MTTYSIKLKQDQREYDYYDEAYENAHNDNALFTHTPADVHNHMISVKPDFICPCEVGLPCKTYGTYAADMNTAHDGPHQAEADLFVIGEYEELY